MDCVESAHHESVTPKEDGLHCVCRFQRQDRCAGSRGGCAEGCTRGGEEDSQNSSKPPSSDITKPPADKTSGGKDTKNTDGKKRKAGGQPGHDRNERNDVPEEQLDAAYEYYAQECPHCGGDVSPVDAPPRKTQQIEIIIRPVVTEHREMAVWCKSCQTLHYTPLPDNILRNRSRNLRSDRGRSGGA